MIEKNYIFASHDVVSFLTNTSIDKSITVISDRLKNDNTLKKRTNIEVDDIMELCEFVLTQGSNFTFSQLADFRQYPYVPLAKSGFDRLLIVT